MWFLIFTFIAATLIIGWLLFGYFILAYSLSLFKPPSDVALPETASESLPFVSIIVACRNEEKHIRGKIENLRQLQYPREKREIVLVDGASTDATVPILEEERNKSNDFLILHAPGPGKTRQLNAALATVRGTIIINTDVDAQLEPDALRWIVAEFARDPAIAVVGAYCAPVKTIPIEQYYWDSQNKGRFLESDANSASIVIAQCYAFRRELFALFPEDVVADDVYVAMAAASRGRKAVYSRYAQAVELRAPRTYADFFYHKYRKSNALLRESLRFLYRLPYMNLMYKVTFLTRIGHQLILPWLLLFWLLLAGSLATMFRFDIIIYGALALFLLFVCTSGVFSLIRLPGAAHRHSLLTQVKGYLCINFILLATSIGFPFYRQESTYSRLRLSDDR